VRIDKYGLLLKVSKADMPDPYSFETWELFQRMHRQTAACAEHHDRLTGTGVTPWCEGAVKLAVGFCMLVKRNILVDGDKVA
jgi:hypothetical protein